MKNCCQFKEAILLIGGTGFIGRNILDYIVNNDVFSNHTIVVLSRNCQLDFFENIEYISGDYSDKNLLESLFTVWNFSLVFHCASSITPLSSGSNIKSDINDNLLATINLLDVMKEFGCSDILYISSGGAVYGDKDLHLISENERCNPSSSYGLVKLTIENYIRFYHKQFGINYLILRVSNPFGKFHNSEKQGIINVAIRKALKGQRLEVWGDGTQSKDYIFVDDLVNIIFGLLKNGITNKTVNVGSGEVYQLNAVLLKIKNHLPGLEVDYLKPKSTDVGKFCLDISFLKSLLKIELTQFDEAIAKTILREKEFLDKIQN